MLAEVADIHEHMQIRIEKARDELFDDDNPRDRAIIRTLEDLVESVGLLRDSIRGVVGDDNVY